MKKKQKCGQWSSPIEPSLIPKEKKSFSQILVKDKTIFWNEMRPEEKGRWVIVKYSKDEGVVELTPLHLSVKSKVYEYGGGAFTVIGEDVYFVNASDQRIYKNDSPLTEPGPFFGDLTSGSSYLIAVGQEELKNFLVIIDRNTGVYSTLAEGSDFYSSPILSPDGKKLAFLTWDYPNMPWDKTNLWVGDFSQGKLTNIQKVAGNGFESIFQPSWSPTGVLHFVSDRTNWWNLYCFKENKVIPLCKKSAEFGEPQWNMGMSSYAFNQDEIICSYVKKGKGHLASLSENKDFQRFKLEESSFSQVRAGDGFVAFIGASPKKSSCITLLDLKTHEVSNISKRTPFQLHPAFFSKGKLLEFTSEKNRKAYGFYYPPKNRDFGPLDGELPPLIVMAHGGPTANSPHVFRLNVQFWTSRGFAVLDVNYGGSSGFGRLYRDRLKHNWGIVDVEDCIFGAAHLIEKKLADPKRVTIRGGSAGGFTTLLALCSSQIFSAGASYYGVSDLETLALETHKFESGYLEWLIGPLKESKELYRKRSPLYCSENLKRPVIFFQGTEDKIVPVNQSKNLFDVLQKKGIQTQLAVYQGEGHGFCKAENIEDSLSKELEFYLKVWE